MTVPVRLRTAARIAAFRIVKRKFAASAFTGLGARQYGGRWNSAGTGMIYTAGSIALAVLEWRAHLAQWPPPDVCVMEVELDESFIWTPAKLPQGWKLIPAPPVVAAFGDAWINSRRSAVMRVPSAIVNQEWNYLLNPGHPDFLKLKIGKPQLFKLDPRLGPMPANPKS